GEIRTLVEHWNGSQWSVVPSPNGAGNNALNGVAAVSANDVWAVGSISNQTLIEHWDGTQWNIVPNPGNGILYAASALSANDVWAVGIYWGATDTRQRTFTEHYVGACSVTATPTATSTPNRQCIIYYHSTATATIVPGTTDTGNHCDDCNTAITLPFAFRLYT